MAAISMPHSSPWIVARWAFKMLMERAATQMEDDSDKEAIYRAIALDGLHFDLLAPDQRKRIANAVGKAAVELRSELLSNKADPDPRDLELADMLGDLELRVSDLRS